MYKILMIEDDRGLIRVVGDKLKAEGYEFKYVMNGMDGLHLVLKEKFDLILMDLMLPEVSGFDVIRELRSRGETVPVIITSAKFQMSDKVSGLRLGADDYLVKPFDFDELLVRMEVQLRRKQFLEKDSDILPDNKEWYDFDHEDINFGDFTLKLNTCELFQGSTSIPLSNIEFKLLTYLILNRDRVITIDELLEKVWDYTDVVSTRTLYVHIAWIRKKVVNRAGSSKCNIRTVRNIGYQFTSE